ncbi:unnamed protein product [Prunus armeniaca]
MIWPFTKNGSYSVKSGYHWIIGNIKRAQPNKIESSHQVDKQVWKCIWECKTLPKIKLFMWHAVHGIVPTFASLFKGKLSPSPLCPLCHDFPESVEHVLFLCPWARKVWYASSLSFKPDDQAFSFLEKQWILSLASILCWSIWKARCSFTYDHHCAGLPNLDVVARLASQDTSEFLATCSPEKGVSFPSSEEHVPRPTARNWLPPLNHDGEVVGGKANLFQELSADQAEGQALLDGLSLAKDNGFLKIIMETGSKVCFSAAKDVLSSVKWLSFFHAIKDLRASFESLQWSWVPREANQAADWVASQVKRGLCAEAWVNRPPTAQVFNLSRDGLPCPPTTATQP